MQFGTSKTLLKKIDSFYDQNKMIKDIFDRVKLVLNTGCIYCEKCGLMTSLSETAKNIIYIGKKVNYYDQEKEEEKEEYE